MNDNVWLGCELEACWFTSTILFFRERCSRVQCAVQFSAVIQATTATGKLTSASFHTRVRIVDRALGHPISSRDISKNTQGGRDTFVTSVSIRRITGSNLNSI